MHPSPLISCLLFFLSAVDFSSALPFIARWKQLSESLAARATYSVVPIDGSGSGSDATQTIVVTPSPTTKTVVETPPAITDTIVITAGPATHTVSTTISVVDIQPPTNTLTTTVTEENDTATSTFAYPSTGSIITATPSSTIATISSTASAVPSSTEATSASSPTDNLPTPTTSASVSSTTIGTTSTPVSSWSWSSTSSYDDGYWHTSYPPWNGTVTRRFARQN
ncbi:hypothetical protein F5Y05DRAFT_368485 [Hypoxylon sp. FL0543]|nr:hypothetical protein F5Y05DRAFT_368485 [Hypoxylon sp. FL0543]